MPDFFALLQELVGLTACEAPAPELRSVEARFRAALPKIMRRFFAPANGASVKERELQAVLKLLAHITKHCPGVFHCSDGAAIILLVIGYLLPCFAEQLFKGMGQPLFEALAGLLSLLWKENRQLYILFFVDLLRLLEDLASVASFFSKPSLFTDCTEVSVQAFSSTYLAAVENASDDVSALWPDRISLPGVMLNLTGKERWQPVATWMINLAHHCLMEGASHISGLVGPTTFDIIMSFLSFDEPSLHKACFELLHVLLTVLGDKLCPVEDLVSYMIALLRSYSRSSLATFRSPGYEVALGRSLEALWGSSRSLDPVLCHYLILTLTFTVHAGSNPSLKVIICKLLGHFFRDQPWRGRQISTVIRHICQPDISLAISQIVQHVVDTNPLFLRNSGVIENMSSSALAELAHVSEEQARQRPLKSKPPAISSALTTAASVMVNTRKRKLQASVPELSGLLDAGTETTAGAPEPISTHADCPDTLTGNDEQDPVAHKDIRNSHVASFEAICEYLGDMASTQLELKADATLPALTALRAMANVFAPLPGSYCWRMVVKHIGRWIIVFSTLETEVTSQTVQLLGLLFEAIDKLLTWHVTRPSLHESCHRSILRWEDLLREDLWEPMAFGRFLLLPWTLTLEDDIHSYSGMLKIKLRATRLAASAYNATLEKGLQKILRAGLEDKEAQLRAASVILMAGLVPLLDKTSITQCWMSVRSLARDPADTVRWSVARAIGLAGCCSAGCTVKCLKHTHQSGECECNKISRKQEIDSVLGPAAACASLEHPSCSLCDAHNRTPYVRTPPGSAEVEIGGVLAAEPVHHCEDPDVSILWQSLSQQLLFEEQSSKVQAEFVLSGGRILRHALPEVLKQGSTIWLRFLDQVPLHPDWTVRAAFGSISGRFMSLSALEGLFGDMSEQAGSNFELTDATEVKRQALEMLSNLRSHFRNAKQPEIRQTLMTAVKEVARACAKGSELLFFCLVLLLEQLDSSLPFLTSAAIDSIKQIACLHWPQSRPSSVHGMLETFKEELYDYLSSCLISQPVLVMVFAEEVMSVSLKELVKSMTPMVIPKLVIEQHGNEQALAVLRRIAEVLDLELPQLLVDWAHKVLACALPQADSDVLLRVLSFYEEVTASGYLDLFRAVIEALLVELVFILGDATTAENPHRSERVASTFKKITRIMSDSEDLPSFLREYLVGILNSIEYKLLRANELDLKRKGLRCIDKLADFIGPHLSAFVPKFTGLLTNALEVKYTILEAAQEVKH